MDLGSNIGGFFADIGSKILDIGSKILDIVPNLIKGIKDLFIPSKGFFSDKVDGLRSNFGFANSVLSTFQMFGNFFTQTDFSEPPSITVDLTTTNTKYNYGTSAKAIDLKWYTKYKPMVDVLLSSFIWVVFVFNTFKDLPSIINGVGTGAHAMSEIDKYQKKG